PRVLAVSAPLHSHPTLCPPRSLPSFPTRRSSDLTLIVALWLAAVGTLAAFIPRALVAGFNDSLVVSVVVVLLLIWLSDAIFVPRDRKSTRLNSSHEWISYAVFRLKKKNAVAR